MKMFVFLLVFSCSVFANTIEINDAERAGIQLTETQRKILSIGHIDDVEYWGGGALGTLFGFGLGHSVQGRWMDRGWIFTVGEAASVAALVTGLEGCAIDDDSDDLYSETEDEEWCDSNDNFLISAGILGLIGLRIWEVVDIWSEPISHNSHYQSIKKHIEYKKNSEIKSSLYLVPVLEPKRGSSGLAFKYLF